MLWGTATYSWSDHRPGIGAAVPNQRATARKLWMAAVWIARNPVSGRTKTDALQGTVVDLLGNTDQHCEPFFRSFESYAMCGVRGKKA